MIRNTTYDENRAIQFLSIGTRTNTFFKPQSTANVRLSLLINNNMNIINMNNNIDMIFVVFFTLSIYDVFIL